MDMEMGMEMAVETEMGITELYYSYVTNFYYLYLVRMYCEGLDLYVCMCVCGFVSISCSVVSGLCDVLVKLVEPVGLVGHV